MKVEILYFEDCPSYAVALRILREVMAEEGIPGEIELIAVNTNELTFPHEIGHPRAKYRKTSSP